MTDQQVKPPAARGVVFVTHRESEGRAFAGKIVARSLAQAEEVATAGALGEKIDGALSRISVPGDEFKPRDEELHRKFGVDSLDCGDNTAGF